MNIFFLDFDPAKAAQFHCDKHVVKMLLETAQLLSTSVQVSKETRIEDLYKPTHINHPCSIWTRECPANFIWLWELGIALQNEYWKRYHKIHKSYYVINRAMQAMNVSTNEAITSPALAMPDKYKCECPVESYRNYYRGDKAAFAVWKTEIPFWWSE